MKKYLVIDFDSTIIEVETLEELAEEALRDNKNKEEILKQISKITNQGMEGKISFTDSLQKRLSLFDLNQKIIS